MHASVLNFIRRICTAKSITGKTVLEVGSYNVNGSARDVIEALEPALYHGIDREEQKRYVDEVMDASELKARVPAGSYDVVISTEMLEHAEDWKGAIEGMCHALAPGGLIVMTCRGPGFPYHGYPNDFWRFTPADFGAMFHDFAPLHLSEDTDPNSPGVFYAGIAPGGPAMIAAPVPIECPWHSKDAFNARRLQRESGSAPSELAVFYHVACMGNWEEVVREQLALLDRVGLVPRIHLLGTRENESWFRQQGYEVYERNGSMLNYETPTLLAAWNWARENPDGAVLYLHTKGVSQPENQGKQAWRRLMEHYLIKPWRENLEKLRTLDMVGVDWQESPTHPHFSGNFWMARSEWLAHLPSPEQHRRDGGPAIIDQPWDRMAAEMWLGCRPWHAIESLCCKNTNLWEGPAVFDLLSRAAGEEAEAEHIAKFSGGSVLDLRGHPEPDAFPKPDADTIILGDCLERMCNGGAGQLLMNLGKSDRWKRLIVRTTPGASTSRRPKRSGNAEPFDVEKSGFLKNESAERIHLSGNNLLLCYKRE